MNDNVLKHQALRLWRQGQKHHEGGDIERAIEFYTKSLGVYPTADIGSYLVKRGKLDEAIDWLEKAKTAPRYEPRHFPYMNLGRIYARKWMVHRAIQEFEAALSGRADLSCRARTTKGIAQLMSGCSASETRSRAIDAKSSLSSPRPATCRGRRLRWPGRASRAELPSRRC